MNKGVLKRLGCVALFWMWIAIGGAIALFYPDFFTKGVFAMAVVVALGALVFVAFSALLYGVAVESGIGKDGDE